ncbi:hypothetical protein QU41_00010, partial [Bradyrhizobium elkanii]
AFFGELELLGFAKGGASVSTRKVTRLLGRDLVGFRLLMAWAPAYAGTIDIVANWTAPESQ